MQGVYQLFKSGSSYLISVEGENKFALFVRNAATYWSAVKITTFETFEQAAEYAAEYERGKPYGKKKSSRRDSRHG